ncbi:disease resistance protein RML1A-like [Rosa chinensis]|uniref:disease resistance protein RML1A-like n=1 Tax=Rosa chinensis TaxID=74649 RepID=UPI000D0909FB|nr:disease resistance protein RML1A-like [Rosa chinensis]
MNMATAVSFCSAIIPRKKYDVFLSFRGEDTRNTFTSHLHEALCRNKIQTYIDYKLERGDEISPALLKAISESKLSVIIFSKNYASSTWCLDELVHILQCRGRQFVIPIFYGVDPSHVRKQSGSYADAFVQHEERFKDTMDKVRMWRVALTTAANISGFDSQTIRLESELVKIVVSDILAKLNRKSQITSGFEGLVGIEKHIQQVELLLCLDSLDVQIVGIWGMGGIGKTTIADVIFHRLSSQFEACCYIANVREASETKHGLNELRNQLLRTILKEENLYMTAPSIGSTFARERLCCTKALVVLDDASDLSQVEYLAGGYRNLFGPGSRIIIASRNKRMLGNGLDDGKIYEVRKLDYDEALELFHLRAFTNISSTADYTTLSRKVVNYAGGNPLALKIFGSVFSHCRGKEDWEGELDKLKKFPNKNIQNVLRWSYDGLEENDKDIFLDIACYYKGEDIDYTKRMLHASGFCANAGIRLLIDMSLISINYYSRLEMHDLIQEMGHKIVRDQCVKDPGKRSRLWIAKDVCYVLQHNKGTEVIECLVMSMDPISDLYIEPSAFKKMQNLRLLRLLNCVNKIHLPKGLKFLPQALITLQWDGYPLNTLPSKFYPDNLVELRMPHSRLERLWDKDQKINLGSLKHIDLGCSEHLADVSALIESPNLESISLYGCTSLVQLPSFFQNLPELTDINLYGCSNLKILPEMPGNLKFLNLGRTAIEELPSSIWSLEKLYALGLGSCEELKNLQSSACRLNSLQSLDLNGCLSLESLSVELPSRLRKLDLRNCKSLRSLPVKLPSRLRKLDLRNCKSLQSLPFELPSGPEDLNLSNCKSLRSLPVELPSRLNRLSLRNCKSLRSLPVELPSGLNRLTLRNCKSLGSLPVELPSRLKKLSLRNCKSLGSLPIELPSGLNRLSLRNCKSLRSLPVELPFGLKKLSLRNCKSLGSLPVALPSRLKRLSLKNCKSLGSLPVELPSGLNQLSLRNCKSLGSLPVELPSGLKILSLRNCKSLGSLPVALPSRLKRLSLSYCKSLGSLPVELPSELNRLSLRNCKCLGSLPVELPSGLKRLSLRNCKSLGSFSVLPDGLVYLDLSKYKSLESLPVELPSGLVYLHLRNCKSLGSLPVELPSGLRKLDLRNCKSLGSLPKLPCLLKELDAHGCTSLETVSSSMRTAPIQGWDQYAKNFEATWPDCFEQHIFINCLKLDQSARSNIMADAQLRVMRIATASRPSDKYRRRAQLRIVCPGNEIPKWLRYQSEGHSINIKLPPHWFRQGFMGYALCIVLAFNNFTPPPDIGCYFSFEIHYKTNNGQEGCWETLRIRLPDILMNSDHVFVWYFCPKYVELESAINRDDWVKASEASLDFMLYKRTYQNRSKEKNPLDLSTVRVKRCGVSLLYAQDFENLLGGIDEDVVVEPKQVIEEEDIIIKT